jgi:hypothetical protein
MEPAAYLDAAITNLFYWVNIVHDLMKMYTTLSSNTLGMVSMRCPAISKLITTATADSATMQ